jgi:hypothetical protein
MRLDLIQQVLVWFVHKMEYSGLTKCA